MQALHTHAFIMTHNRRQITAAENKKVSLPQTDRESAFVSQKSYMNGMMKKVLKSINSNQRYRKMIAGQFFMAQCISRHMSQSSSIKRVSTSMYRSKTLNIPQPIVHDERHNASYIHTTKTKQQEMNSMSLTKRCKLERHSIELTAMITMQQLSTWRCGDQDQSHSRSGI